MHKLLPLLLCISFVSGYAQWLTPFEQSEGKETTTYQQAIDFYQRLADTYAEASLLTYGKTDVGKPLHVFVISKDGQTNPEAIKNQDKRIILVNNGIHAGEPCGVDASMMLARDILRKPDHRKYLEHVTLLIIPAYNIGGLLNRGCCSRANQLGPIEHGFRGNARNYDLNRDFIKSDTRNARSFAGIFHSWKPDIFIDTHTTNGADYQATLTYIPTHAVKLDKEVAAYMERSLIPAAVASVEHMGYKISPYVNVFNQPPDKGFAGFIDLPRYSSGYAGLFQTMAFITEAHMLKPFGDRVQSTYAFLKGVLLHTNRHYKEIGELIRKARMAQKTRTEFDVSWKMDQSVVRQVDFDGYEAKYKESEVTGKKRLYYDRSAPFHKKVPYLNHYVSNETVKVPQAYIVPQAYEEVIQLLQLNRVKMFPLKKDTVLTVEVQYIEELKTNTRSYEGHFYHQEFDTRKDTQALQYYEGDMIIFPDQTHNAYIVHVLEPKSQDSFFRWNYFDGILMQKEYFSSYVFEETAKELLDQNSSLKALFNKKKEEDADFASNARQQLDFIYKHSSYYEKTHNRYPVSRWNGTYKLPIY